MIQTEVGRQFSVSALTVCNWEKGKTVWECGEAIMTQDHQCLVASFLGVAEEGINEKIREQRNERQGKIITI